jgi:peptidoglycan/xylan/chitin deacetylase (PgdA/CDA1 family)
MRLDRLITLNLASFLRCIRFRDADPAIPILMYHSISNDPEAGVSHYYRTNTSVGSFEAQMGFLADNGFRGIDIAEGLELLAGFRRAGPVARLNSIHDKPVVITFDDGFKDFLTAASPILLKRGFKATVFLPTAFIQGTPQVFKGRECLTWDQVRELRKLGMHFGSHTVNHPRLIDLAWKDIEQELRNSKTDIEKNLGERITTFAHPYAFPQADKAYVRGFRRLLVEAGYECCATTEIGRANAKHDHYCLRRLPVNSCDDAKLFSAKLEGAYDWLARPQALTKRFKQSVFGRRLQACRIGATPNTVVLS